MSDGGAARQRKKSLTHQEERVLFFLAQGLSNQGIAEELHISPHDVNLHVRKLIQKHNLKSRDELLRMVGHAS